MLFIRLQMASEKRVLERIMYLSDLASEIREFGFNENGEYGNQEPRRMTTEEFEEMVSVTKDDNFILYPYGTSEYIGFAIARVVIPDRKASSCFFTCREDQLPEGESFDTLIKSLLQEDHLERAKKAGENIAANRSFYEK